MVFNIRLTLYFILLILTVSCSKKIRPEKPDDASTTQFFENELSYVHIPFEVYLSELEGTINKQVKDVLYTDDSFDNNDNDNLKLKVTKIKPITISAKGNDLYYSVPLNIWAEYRKSILGMELKKGTDFDAILKFKTSIGITEKWNLTTETTSEGYTWLKEPVLDFTIVEVPVTPLVKTVLDEELPEIALLLDEEIKESFDLRKEVYKLWIELQKPYLMDEDYRSWLLLKPKNFYLAPIEGNSKKITINIGMDAFVEVLFGEEPKYRVNTELPDLINKDISNGYFHVAIASDLPYTEASRLLKDNVVGYVYEEGKRKVTITDAELFEVGDEIGVRLDMVGSLDGTVYLKGTPVYDAENKMISVENFDFDIKTKKVMLKMADWLLHGAFRRMIQKETRISIKETLEEYTDLVEKSLQENPVTEDIHLRFKFEKVEPQGVYLTEKSILTYLILDGTARVLYGK